MKHALLFIIAFLITQTSVASTFDHRQWDQLLKSHVVALNHGYATAVDYRSMARKRSTLKSYLAGLSEVGQKEFDRWNKQEQLAFLINAYNAWTIEFILTTYPNLESIKDLGSLFSSPWSKSFIPLLGKTRSLDDIEHGLIRGSGRYNDPRIHFAVNCASIGCPALRAEAYVGENLDQQLEEQTKAFLSDRSRNRINGGVLEFSSIFKWYREDFEKGWLGIDSLTELFVQHADNLELSISDVKRLQTGQIGIEFLDYDWRLNDT